MLRCEANEMPGFEPSPRRVYAYVESDHPSSFRRDFEDIAQCYDGPLPSSGGMMNEEAFIQ